MSARELEDGYWRSYERFYSWGSILRGASTKPTLAAGARHFAYAAGWKKFEPMWDLVIRSRRVMHLRPVLERVLAGFARRATPAAADIALPEGIEKAAPATEISG
jgi:hypothetical protein